MFAKEFWTKNDVFEFENYLNSQKNEEKITWTKNSLNTNLPVLAIKHEVLRNIAKEILKGDYISFLNSMPSTSYEALAVSGYIIGNLKNFVIQKKYLKKYALKCDCWASCDILKFKIKNNEENYLILAWEFKDNQKPFIRRIGVIIMFAVIKNAIYLDKVYDYIDSFQHEENYYVNMALAWLLCEMFIKYPESTFAYLKKNNLNMFVSKKFCQKCQDSFRISKEAKKKIFNEVLYD